MRAGGCKGAGHSAVTALSCPADIPRLRVPFAPRPQDRSSAMALFRKKASMPTAEEALPGRSTPLAVPDAHYVNGHRIVAPFPAGLQEAVFGLGCFWGAERKFWQLPGVYSTS